MIKAISNFFGFGKKEKNTPTATGTEQDLTEFVNYVVRSLVDEPEKVNVETKNTDNMIILRVSCVKTDIGKIIGKNGKTIDAIRSLVNGAAGRMGKKSNVEVLD